MDIAEITSKVKAMAEEEEGAEVLVYAQNGSVLGGQSLSGGLYNMGARCAEEP